MATVVNRTVKFWKSVESMKNGIRNCVRLRLPIMIFHLIQDLSRDLESIILSKSSEYRYADLHLICLPCFYRLCITETKQESNAIKKPDLELVW